MTILFAVLLFSFLIFIHELGHFLAAKASGVRVNEFSMFMGPAIFKKQVGDTLYALRCIPIGGYCAMEGENEDTDDPHSFQKAAWWKRLIILVAGSFMNLVAGFLILAIVFAPAKQFAVPVIDSAMEGCTVVREGGLQVGDEILELDGEKIYVQSDFSMMLQLNPGDTHDIVVKRDGKKLVFNDYKMEKHLFPGEETERYGFSFGIEDATFGNKLKYTWNTGINVVRSVRLSLQMMISGQAGIRDMTGPVGIVQIMSDTAEQSSTKTDAVLNVLYIGGFLAINLAVMNMLPIPALDGGRVVGLLLTCAIEKITRKRLDAKYEGYIHGIGMILLLALMALILFKDIFVIFKR
ncbi:MAG: site-2 protease family protein [Oscillospiraceae bacterium]|nr:site-2 protease family protein [Oscillospiraceae bacterium]